MNIGVIAKQAKVNIQTVRYYERISILKPVLRRNSGYRVFDNGSLKSLMFIKRAQELGFTLNEIRELLHLRANTRKERGVIRSRLEKKIAEIQGKLRSLESLTMVIRKLVRDCKKGSLKKNCPILDYLESEF